jgi:GT2 family glycosyltransferase
MINYPFVSVIVTAKNEVTIIEECLTSLFKQDYPNFEIIFIDGKSNDGTYEKALNLKNKLNYFPNCKRYIALSMIADSPAIGRNIGIKRSEGSIIAFTDSDCIAEKNWLINLIKALPSQGGIAGGLNITRHFTNSKVTNTIDAILSSKIGSGSSTQFFKFMNISEVDAVPTCNLAIHKKLIVEAKGFNERLRMAEDLDLCIRIRKMGYKIMYSPDAKVNHYMGIDSFFSFSKFIFKYGFGKGKSLIENKELITHPRLLIWILFSFLFFNLFGIISYFNVLYFNIFIAVVSSVCITIEVFFIKIAIRNKSIEVALFGLFIILSMYILHNLGILLGYARGIVSRLQKAEQSKLKTITNRSA